MAGITPQQYGDQAAASSSMMDAIQQSIVTEYENVQSLAAKPGFVANTGKTALQLQTEAQARLQTQQQMNKIAQATNFDELAITLGQDLAAMASEQRVLTQKIKEDSAVSLFDDPLTALANAFTLPWDQQALEGVTQKIDVTTKAMNAVNNHVQQSAVTAKTIEQSVTQASIDSVSEAAATEAAKQAVDARIKALQTNAHGVQAVMQMRGHELDAYLKQRQVEDADETRSMRREQHKQQRTVFDLQMQKYEDEKQGEARQMGLINQALAADGRNPIDSVRFKQMKATSQKLLDALMDKGLQLEMNGRMTHGETIPERLAYQNATAYQAKTPQQQTVIDMQTEAYKQSAEKATTKDKGVIAASAEKLFVDSFRAGQKNIKEGSPFAAPAYSVMAKTAIGQDPLWIKYIAPSITEANAQSSVDPQRVVAAMSTALMNKEININQASEFISRIYKQSVAINNEVNQYDKVTGGLSQKEYGASIPLTGTVGIEAALIGGRSKLNLVDPVQVTNHLAKQIQINLRLRLNTAGDYPAGAGYQQGGGLYPPKLQSGVITGAK
jgi:hypothetical protein